jgi:hypothetical protein
MVAATGPKSNTPRGPAIDVFCLSGSRRQISDNASHGASMVSAITTVYDTSETFFRKLVQVLALLRT